MLKLLFISIATCCTGILYCQEIVSDYKKTVDDYLAQKFGDSLLTRLSCKELLFEPLNKPGDRSYSKYATVEKKKLQMLSMQFIYELKSKQIQDNFTFWVVILKNKTISDSLSTFGQIPYCIIKDLECSYINRSGIIEIANKDSTFNQDNLVTTFFMSKNDNRYYWIVQGKSPAKQKGVNQIVSYNQLRKIDAVTGKIVEITGSIFD